MVGCTYRVAVVLSCKVLHGRVITSFPRGDFGFTSLSNAATFKPFGLLHVVEVQDLTGAIL